MTEHEPTKQVVGRMQQALAEDERTNVLGLDIKVRGGRVFVMGDVATVEQRQSVEAVVREHLPEDLTLSIELGIERYRAPGPQPEAAGVRLAAVGDVHFGAESGNSLRRHIHTLPERADVLLLAGDLTQHGLATEGRVLADDLHDIGIPIVAVLGNHDYHHDEQDQIRRHLEDVGVMVLERSGVVLDIRGHKLGIGGSKGFGGGFTGACGSEFGEPEMKAFMRHTRELAESLQECLSSLRCDTLVAMTHYAPSRDTLTGERLEIYPFLGSHLLGSAIDGASCDFAVHGHAHAGTERGVTTGGVPVRNVARQVIRQAYQVYCVGADVEQLVEAC